MEQVAKADVSKLLKKANALPGGTELEAYDPLEQVPTVGVGTEITEGMTVAGVYEETQRIVSAKFKNSQERDPQTGEGVQYLHILRLTSGDRLGIWSTGELKMVFAKLSRGELISITYKGKGKNANGQDQHFFNYQKPKIANH